MSNAEPKTTKSQTASHDVYTTASLGAAAQGRNANEELMNLQTARETADVPATFATSKEAFTTIPTIFQSNTIAPSPPPDRSSSSSSSLAPLDTSSRLPAPANSDKQPSPLSAGLRIQTNIIPNYTVTAASAQDSVASTSPRDPRTHSMSKNIPIQPVKRTPSIKNILASSIGSSSAFGSAPNSALSSPMLNAMADVTPLPSPLMSGDSPGPWKKLASRPGSRDMNIPSTANAALVTTNGESLSSAIANQIKRRTYQGLVTNAGDPALINSDTPQQKNAEGHGRNRSISEYTPETMHVAKARHITVSGPHALLSEGTTDARTVDAMRREPHLAHQRGLAPDPKPPTPPSSRTGGESSDSDSSLSSTRPRAPRSSRHKYFEANTRQDSKRRRWRALKVLGQGTFSKVILATSQVPDLDDTIDEDHVFGQPMEGVLSSGQAEPKIDRKKLVAIKICEHGPKGGASEERVEMSLKRELEIMKSINHPSLVHLTAWSIEETRAILVLSYCPGGDLFEVASMHRELLIPALLRRMFSELVGAVRYLHERHIVHRDIKLENVLVNLTPAELSRTTDWQTYPYPVITLTDLGLSRRVADDEKLTTRCGSDDYAAPEVIMGQPYDGRATDAWSLGVLLYALLESRLPFDPHPGMPDSHKQRSRTSHRIARVEYRWVRYAGDEGDHESDPEKFKANNLEGAMVVTENLLKRARSRWTMDKVAEYDWVKNGVVVEGGIKFREEDTPEEVLPHAAGIQSPL